MQYFGSNIVEGVAESWVEAEMSWVEVEMSWVKVDGGGWRWVHGLVLPNYEQMIAKYDFIVSAVSRCFLQDNIFKTAFYVNMC